MEDIKRYKLYIYDLEDEYEKIMRGVVKKEAELDNLKEDAMATARAIEYKLHQLKKLEEQVEGYKNNLSLINDDLHLKIQKHPLVFDSRLEGECLIIETQKIEALTGEKEVIVPIDPVIISINLFYNIVKVQLAEGSAGGRGYWTSYDPHPHVDGTSGTPCLGEAGHMVTVGFEKKDYYLIFLTMIEFLQSINPGDAAGRKYTGWNHYVYGELIEATEGEVCGRCDAVTDENYVCSDCDEIICPSCTVYVESQDGDVCVSCYEEYYFRCENCDNIYSNDELNYVGKLESSFCDTCYGEYLEEHSCPTCNTLVDDCDELYTCHNCDNLICGNCSTFDKYENTICNSCYEDDYVSCMECGGTIHVEDTVKHNSKLICGECEDEMIEEDESDENN
jgi:hypothetical protein